MKIKRIDTSQAPAAIGPYSQATMVTSDQPCPLKGLVMVSGQLPIDPSTGQMLPEDIAAQTLQCLKNIQAILLAAGSSCANILKINVYMTDLSLFGEFNRVYEEFLAPHKPARACVQVAALPKNSMIEIEATAIANPEA